MGRHLHGTKSFFGSLELFIKEKGGTRKEEGARFASSYYTYLVWCVCVCVCVGVGVCIFSLVQSSQAEQLVFAG